MNNYDDWKLQTPEEADNECRFCGESCEGTYCSKDCRKADEQIED